MRTPSRLVLTLIQIPLRVFLRAIVPSWLHCPLSDASQISQYQTNPPTRFSHPKTHILLLFLLTSCSPIPPETISQFHQGVLQTHQQLDQAFHDANTLARQQQLAYLLSTIRPGLSESDLTPALTSNDVAAWDDAFAKIESYANALQTLLTTNQSTQFTTAILALSTQLKSTQTGLTINPGVAAAFTQLSTVLIDLKSQSNAKSIMQKTDPAIRQTLTQMATALGDTNQSPGLRSLVWANWQSQLAQGPLRAYAAATPSQKLAAAQSYAAMLDQRDAQLQTLASLRQSLLLLADAHTAAAHGSDLTPLLTLLTQHLADTQSLLAQFKK